MNVNPNDRPFSRSPDDFALPGVGTLALQGANLFATIVLKIALLGAVAVAAVEYREFRLEREARADLMAALIAEFDKDGKMRAFLKKAGR